jgi:hypothetical protein
MFPGRNFTTSTSGNAYDFQLSMNNISWSRKRQNGITMIAISQPAKSGLPRAFEARRGE